MTWAMEHFNMYLKGRHFTVFSDHKPLETSCKKHERTLNRIKEAFMEWDFTIQYKKGTEMPADFLSRNVVESIEVSDEDLASLQDKDTFCNVQINQKFVARPTSRFRLQTMFARDAKDCKNMLHRKTNFMEKNKKKWLPKHSNRGA